MELGKGKLVEAILPKGNPALKLWEYYINDIRVGVIHKRILPRETRITYIFLPDIRIVNSHYQIVPKGQKGIICDNYDSLIEAKKALRKAIIKQIKYLELCE